MEIEVLLGWVGAFALLISYLLNAFSIWKNTQLIYKLMNLLGAVCLIVNAISLEAYPFILINAMWIVVAVVSIIRK